MLAVDHASRPGDYRAFARALGEAGVSVDVRYLCDPNARQINQTKIARRDEIEAAHAEGIATALVWQNTKGDSHGGAEAGRQHGQWAAYQAAALGAPVGTWIYFAVADYDAPTTDHDRIEAYLRAAQGELGPFRACGYGKNTVGKAMLDRGAVAAWWQSYGFSRPVGVVEPWAAMYQRREQQTIGGVLCDINDVHQPYVGQWGGNMRAVWLPNVLKLAGLEVKTYDGWETRSNGDFQNLRAVVWHHDASPRGNSPGVPAYMIRNYREAGAQCWVDRAGVWHIIASGVAYHAGKVLPGKPSNWDSIGVETDHTTGEDWPSQHLDSLRRGTAAILRHLGRTEQDLEFHKTICSPVGRKVDPDGLEIGTERSAVARLIHDQGDDMFSDHDRAVLASINDRVSALERAMFEGAPDYGVPGVQAIVTEIGYSVAGYDLDGKPSLIRRLAQKAGIGVPG